MQTSAVMRARRTLVVVDPGRVRLRSAAATTASLVVAIAAMFAITRATGQPVTIVMFGAVVAMQSSAAVKDRDQRSRNITTLLMSLPALGAVTLAAALAPHGPIADVGFIAVLFGAVWLRRYGPRGNALGMVAFMSYFFALFLRATLPQVPMLAVAVAVGIAASLLVHIAIFPERPRAEARRLLSALRTVSTAVLDAACTPEHDDVEALRRRLDRLGETALLIDDWLDRHEAAESLSVTSKDLALRVFEAQIMLEQLAVLLWNLAPEQAGRHDLDDAVAALRICLTDDPDEDDLRNARRSSAAAADRADLSEPAGLATMAAFRTTQAHLAIHHITTNALGAESDEPGDIEEAEEDAGDEDSDTGLHPSTKAAIQVSIATSAATILGELISPNRWYWAVLTAFLVFTGVTTRGELLSRAGHRIVGTLAGVAAGVLLAALIGERPPVQIVVLLVCVFCAFYLAAVSYIWLTFFTTVLLAMLYGLMGTFSLEVLELRIAETAVGAVVGIAAAYFVFSTKTRATFVEKVSDYLDQLDDIIDAATDSVLSPGGDTDLVTDTRRLDTALQNAITAGKPLQMGPRADLRHGVRRLLRGLQIGNRSAHALARAGVFASRAEADSRPPRDTVDAVRHAATRAHATIAAIRKVLAGEAADTDEKRSDMVVFDMVGVSEIPPGPVRAAVRAINTLDRVLAEVTVRA